MWHPGPDTKSLFPINCDVRWDKPADVGKAWELPAFKKWEQEVAALPAQEQIKAVAKKLQELNPGFDGKLLGDGPNGWNEKPRIENGVVTGVGLGSPAVSDLSPLRAFSRLKGFAFWKAYNLNDLAPLSGLPLRDLMLHDSSVRDLVPLTGMPLESIELFGTFDDLSPLKGMKLQTLRVRGSRVSDLETLRGMPLQALGLTQTLVSDLSPLEGMPLELLTIGGTQASDLSPLRGVPLTTLRCDSIPATDLTPLRDMKLTKFTFSPQTITQGIEVVRGMTSITEIGSNEATFAPAEFWKKYDAGDFGKPDAANATASAKPIATYKDPAFKKWQKGVAKLPAERQIEEVVKKLQQLNPGFDGKVAGLDSSSTPNIVNGVVTGLAFNTDAVTDVSPVRALVGLKKLYCVGTPAAPSHGQLSDLSPLQGMSLTNLTVANNSVADLSPLEGMPLTLLDCQGTPVANLSALKGMKLTMLAIQNTQVSNLLPLKGMPITDLFCHSTKVSDLSPLEGMPLVQLHCSETQVFDLSPLKGMPLMDLECAGTPVADLSPLKGMPITRLLCNDTPVTDLSALEGMALKEVWFTPKNITKGIDVIRQITGLTRIAIGWAEKEQFTHADFWKKYDAGDFGKPNSANATPANLPITTYKNAAFKKWQKDVAKLPAEEQVKAVASKLQELNPGFDGKETHKIEGGVVFELAISSDDMTDLSPVRALTGFEQIGDRPIQWPGQVVGPVSAPRAAARVVGLCLFASR